METERFHSLIEKYLSGKTTAEENAKLRAMMDEEDAAQAFDEYAFSQWQNASGGMSGIQKERIRRKLLIGIKAQKKRLFRRIFKWTAAAVVVGAVQLLNLGMGVGQTASMGTTIL